MSSLCRGGFFTGVTPKGSPVDMFDADLWRRHGGEVLAETIEAYRNHVA